MGDLKRRSTLRQRKFVIALLGPATGNQTEAARLAGYRGDRRQLAVQGSLNMKNQNVQEMVSEMLDSIAKHALDRLAEGLDATRTKSFLTKSGALVKSDPEVHYSVRLRTVELWHRLRQKERVGRTNALAPDTRSDVGAAQQSEHQDVAEPASAMAQDTDILGHLKALNQRARELAAKAEGAGEYKTALMAIRELTRLVELTAKMTGELDEAAEGNHLHMHLSRESALAVAKTYVERHSCSVEADVDGVEQAQPATSDAVTSSASEDNNDSETDTGKAR